MFQCQNCWCIPDYCPQAIPRSSCPCDEIPCYRATGGTETGAVNAHQQQLFILPQPIKYFLAQHLFQQTLPAQVSGQLIMENQQQQQQFIKTLGALQQNLPQQVRISGIQQPRIPPLYVIRTIEQPGQVLRQVQQVPEFLASSQYASAMQVPMQQTQVLAMPSFQQMTPQVQHFSSPFQLPIRTVTLQVPGKFDPVRIINLIQLEL